uniref:Gamma-tubulin complex component 6 n=1 Tax=Oncorhynchus kisutch TaxID=8019 RepID=A0A8C7MQW6_ONCKI
LASPQRNSGALLTGVSWKRRALGGVSREGVRRTLRKRAYGALLSKLFQEGSPKGFLSVPSATSTTPPRNKLLMISFDLRVAGCQDEAERLEEQLGRLSEGPASGLKELDSVLELLVQLTGSAPPPPASFSRDYMRRERPVLRRPPLGGYQSEELQRLEARAWALMCGEEWGSLKGLCGTLGLMDAPPGTGLLALRRRSDVEERFEKETRMSLFGALQHSRTSDLDIRLNLPPVPSNADVTGLAIRVPPCLDQLEDEGFQSASNLTPDSQSEPSPSPELDVWDALRTFEPGRRRCWESVGCPPGKREFPYLTEGGREAFDQLYRLWEGEMRVVCSASPSPLLPLPLDCQTQLVSDLLNVLIGVASTTFPLNQVCVNFDVRPGVCVSGASPESVSSLLGELAQYGTHYLRLSRFVLQSAQKRGLVFQAFTGGLRKYLHYYRACVLSTPPTLSLLTIGFLFRKVGRQLRYLSELCCVDGASGVGQATFPVGVTLLSYLYNEAQSNCSNENYPVLLSLLKSSCEPYTRFVSDWVYSGVFRDVYGEFMIQVNEDYLSFRDKHFWAQGYTLISRDVEDCVPVFLRHIANDVYVCGKTINLLKICCPQHYICWSELPVPRIAVTFSLQEVEEIERDCAVYRGRMERIAKHSATSREEQVLEWAKYCVCTVGGNQPAVLPLSPPAGRQVSQRLAEEAKKRERFEELRQHLEQEQEVGQRQEDEFSFARELRDREKRLQALEEQLEIRARKELIAQYSHLSEEAAKREWRAMWRVQRMRLDDSRAQFLQQDQQETEVSSTLSYTHTSLSPEPCEEPTQAPLHHQSTPPALPTTKLDLALVTEHIDANDFLPKPADSLQVDQALQEIGSDLPEALAPHKPVDYDFSAPYSPLEGVTAPALARPRWGPVVQPDVAHPHIPTGPPESTLGMGCVVSGTLAFPSPLPGRQASPSLSGPSSVYELPTANIQGHASDAHIKVGEHVSDVEAPLPSQNVHGHSSDANIKVGEFVSEVTAPLPTANVHGHSSDANIKVGEFVSEVTAPLPTANVHGHSSDANIKVGEFVSEVTAPLPTANVHGHASDAHIKVGDHVSEVVASLFTQNIHGHASDSHIKVGEHMSEEVASIHTQNIHGHSSDTHFKAGCVMSVLHAPLPGSDFGHASDSTLGGGCVVSGTVTLPSPIPGSDYGHSSDSAMGGGCVISGIEPVRPPLPGSNFGQSSDSTLGTGCVVSGVSPLPSPIPGSIYGHSSDSALGGGCKVSGVNPLPSPIPGSIYGHSSDSALGGGCKVKETGNEYDARTLEQQEQQRLAEGISSWAAGLALSPGESSEREYLRSLAAQYQVEQYEDCYGLMSESPLAPECHPLHQVTRGPWGLPVDPSLRRATDTTVVQLSGMVSLPVLMKHSVTTPLITHVSLVNKAVVDYYFVELGVERHFEALRHFLLMEDGEFAQSLSDLIFEKMGSGQTPGELLTPLVLNSILSKALQYSLHGDSSLAPNFTFALRFLPETFHPHAPDALNCLELRYKVDWPLNIIITDSCMNKYNRLFSFLLQLKHMVWSLRDVWFHLKRTALVKGAGRSVQFRQLQLYRHEMQHFVKVIQGYIANQILQVSWLEFTTKLASASDLDAIHRTHADYLNRAIFRGLLTEKAAPVMNIIHSIFSLILKFRAQLIAQPWDSQQGEAVHPSFIAMQQSYNTFKYYSHFLFKVVTKLVNRGYQPHLEDFLLRINFNNYYKDS